MIDKFLYKFFGSLDTFFFYRDVFCKTDFMVMADKNKTS